VHARLVQYKRIASAKDADELREVQVEMIDRFGLLPSAAKTLFRLAELKLIASEIGILKIEVGASGGRIIFAPNPRIDPMKIIQLIQQQPGKYRLDGPDKLRFSQVFENPDDKAAFVEKLLGTLVG
jgi:transcription-repair coupling factor (superfamily II helicase)